ncbi:hypothetical protein ACFSL6_08775 [Paenibacillus thailandensis]|uniref:HeH/LEM domain-containing protein n=1 Tax=Paenibacillus thailandensis TaxID=393250 RepID=A0ABW5QTN0_9BACL
MPIQINISGEAAAEVAQLVHDLAWTMQRVNPADVPAETNVSTADAPKTRKPRSASKHEEPNVDALAKEIEEETRTAAAETVQYEADDTDSDEVEIPTDVQLREVSAAKAKTAGKEKVKALLQKYGVPNVTGVPANKRIAFLRDLEALE